jgi:hypothetical protein
MPAVLLLQAPKGAGSPRPPPKHSRHQNLPEASQDAVAFLKCIFLGCMRCTGEYSSLNLQAAVSNLQGGWLPPSPPAIAINVRSYACFFCSSPANDTGLLLQQPCKRHWCKRIGTTLRGTAEHTPAPSLNASFKAKLDPECSLKSLRGLSCPFCAAPLAPRLCNQRTKLHLV